MLYIVGTPIGNLGDMSPRALEALQAADVVACEDTRRTGLLLSKFSIKKPLISYHEHNRAARGEQLLGMLKEGKQIALVSDAGMPCISDPGSDLVRQCAENEIQIQVVSGPVAAVSALVQSGLDTSRFVFEGFLPASGSERKERIGELSCHRHTFILYEAPHRLQKTLRDLANAGYAKRRIAVCRELTKKYEEVIRTTIEEALVIFSDRVPKGEFVLVIEGGEAEKPSTFDANASKTHEERVNELSQSGISTKEMSEILAKEWGDTKKNVYSFIIKMIK